MPLNTPPKIAASIGSGTGAYAFRKCVASRQTENITVPNNTPTKYSRPSTRSAAIKSGTL